MKASNHVLSIVLTVCFGWLIVGIAQEDKALKIALESLPSRFSITHPGFPVKKAEGYSNPNLTNEQEENTPLEIQFQGNRFQGKQSGRMSDQVADRGLWDSVYETTYEGSFREGVLRGTFKEHTVKWFHWEPGPYMDYTYFGSLYGTMDNKGKLVLKITIERRKVLLRSTNSSGHQGNWEDNSPNPGYGPLPTSFPLVLQLPVKGAETTAQPNPKAIPYDIEVSGSEPFKARLALTALLGAATAGLTALGASLIMLNTGVTSQEAFDGVRELLGGSSDPTEGNSPSPVIEDDFERWKRNYESRGWVYTEKDGVAEFEPVEGATNESGWVYSKSRGGFVQPEDERAKPGASAPDGDAGYREQVRLLQEDLERQRDFLDRERERLREYEKSGLDDLLPGTRERIRQYEKLSDLNQSELERLDENRPTHTVEDNRDLEADAKERLRSRDTIREINESEERSDAIQERSDTETNRENATRAAEELVSQNLGKLENRMQEIIDKRNEEGYYVRNSDLVKKAWNNTLGWVVEKAGGWKGGQCGEFGQWGVDWSEDSIHEIFGPDAVVTTIAASNNPYLGHRATKVILPDGRRMVLDFWESMPEGKASIYSEKEWIERWDKKLYGDYLGKADVVRHEDELNLKDLIGAWGEDEGKTKFRTYHTGKGKPRYAETFIRSWEKEPW